MQDELSLKILPAFSGFGLFPRTLLATSSILEFRDRQVQAPSPNRVSAEPLSP